MKKKLNKIGFYVLMMSLFLVNTLNSYASDLIHVPMQENQEKIVYLTFDDGPIPKVTERILDVLNENQVKATFFVVGKEIKQREAILQRMHHEGHSIGLHTYSHNFKEIYKSEDTFINEMKKTLVAVNEVLGENLDIRIIRFPGGSAGRLNETFFKELEEHEYKIFDWNVNLQDGINPNITPSEIVRNAKKCRDQGNRRIILAHCNSNNKSTCTALPQIIEYYKKEGYIFKAIDNNTEPYYYRFKKTNLK